MKTVIATDNGSITSDSTAGARLVTFKAGDSVTLNDIQADFLVECGKAKHIEKAEPSVEAPKKATKKA